MVGQCFTIALQCVNPGHLEFLADAKLRQIALMRDSRLDALIKMVAGSTRLTRVRVASSSCELIKIKDGNSQCCCYLFVQFHAHSCQACKRTGDKANI